MEFRRGASELFEVVAMPIDPTTEDFLRCKLATAGSRDLEWISSLLRQAPHDFVFTHEDFVFSFLEACDRVSRPVRRRAVGDLFASSISGVRRSNLGEPPDADILNSQRASEIMSRLSRGSSAFELYNEIHDHAQLNIARAKFDADSFEDD